MKAYACMAWRCKPRGMGLATWIVVMNLMLIPILIAAREGEVKLLGGFTAVYKLEGGRGEGEGGGERLEGDKQGLKTCRKFSTATESLTSVSDLTGMADYYLITGISIFYHTAPL